MPLQLLIDEYLQSYCITKQGYVNLHFLILDTHYSLKAYIEDYFIFLI